MSKITITEALAEIPTIEKRIEKKREFIRNFLYRQSAVRDPHEKDGGSVALIEREMQAIGDLQNRRVAIRSAIQNANQDNSITVEGTTRTITDWLTWRREIVQGEQAFLGQVASQLNAMRQDALRKGLQVSEKDMGVTMDIVVNVNERKLAETRENLEKILGVLDGQLSLKNATILVDIP